jgi:hypothetical protein
MKLRLAILALTLALVSAVAVMPQTTHAAARTGAAPTAPTSGVTVPFNTTITDATGATVATINSLTITGFSVVNGVLTATGTVNGTSAATGQAVSYPFTSAVSSASGSCQILDLTLGPINLDLLGLQLTTNTIHINLTAQSGSGQLLGNLLCSVAHLLDQNNLSGLSQLLNGILRLLNGVTLP